MQFNAVPLAVFVLCRPTALTWLPVCALYSRHVAYTAGIELVTICIDHRIDWNWYVYKLVIHFYFGV